MKCLILAAGYATRMYPLTKEFPKPLLAIKGKPLLEYLLEDLELIGEIQEYLIVTNHRFINIFQEWKQGLDYAEKIKLFDDGSTENENRLGAVKDIQYVLEQDNLSDDLLVLAGDNLLDFSLSCFIETFQKKRRNLVLCHEELDIEKLRRTGVAELAEDGRIISMEEKPLNPKGRYAIPPFYILKMEDLGCIEEGIQAGCNVDSPGAFIVWLCKHRQVYTMKMPGKRIDIGSLESYENVR